MIEPRHTGPLELLSGPWTAVWQQGSDQGEERLNLIFQESQVLGFGSDGDGEFQYTGTFSSTGTVNLGKVYTRPLGPVPARMTYLGQWNGRRILGRWVDDRDSSNAGPFRMWPGHGPDPGEVLEAEAEPGLEAELVAVQPLSHPLRRNQND
jgi:hypothetical protein